MPKDSASLQQHSDKCKDIAKEVLRECIRKRGENEFRWDEYQLCNNWPLLVKVCEECEKQIDRDIEMLCALGRSGLALGMMISRLKDMPLVWIDSYYRLVPTSYSNEIRNKKICLVDSHMVYGWNAINSYQIIKRYEGDCKQMLILVNCDNFSDERIISLEYFKLDHLLKVSECFETIRKILGIESEEAKQLIGRPEFWRR